MTAHPGKRRLRIRDVEQADSPADVPALYRTRITHLRRAPVHHYFEHHSYSWYIDLDDFPRLPRWLRSFARFDAGDHFDGEPGDTLRQRIDAFLASRGVDLRGGTITALLQARVLGYAFNPLSLYWCHNANGFLHCVVAEVHNTRGAQHVYLLPPDGGQPTMVMKQLTRRRSMAKAATTWCGRHAGSRSRRDDFAAPGKPARIRGDAARQSTTRKHRSSNPAAILAPLAPLMAKLGMRIQGITLWLRRVPMLPQPIVTESERVGQL